MFGRKAPLSPQPNARFLVVDDDDVDRETITRLMGKLGRAIEIVAASSLAEAETRLAESHFDCVLLDYNLGAGLGLELIPAVHRHQSPACPVILVTQSTQENLIVEAMRHGVFDYIPKSALTLAKLGEVIDHSLNWSAREHGRLKAEIHERETSLADQQAKERSLRDAIEQAESANRAKSLFVAHISHELRTPMNAVIGLTYLLERTPLDEEQAGLVEKLRLSGKTLLDIIQDVLDLSKIEAGEMVLESAPFSLFTLICEVVAIIEPQARARKLTFALDLPPDLPPVLLGDSVRIHRVLLNLLGNAVKFTEEGSVGLSVHCEARGENRIRLRFAVTDTGIGISEEAMDRLFRPFVQADSSTTRRYGGTGLGLSIVSQLLELMGSSIDVSSLPGTGSEFAFSLELPLSDMELPEIESRGEVATGPNLPGVRILVVDDSDINVEMARRMLELEGAVVDTASNGREAVDTVLAQAGQLDIVLMDVQMPVLDGFDATRRIRNGLGLTKLPIIALTAGMLTSQRQEALACGMDDYLAKPFDTEDLIACIRRHVDVPGLPERPFAMPLRADGAKVEWPRIEGMDHEVSERRFGGDVALLRRLLRRLFAYAADLDRIEEAAPEAGEQLTALLHKLKGSAGMLGVNELHEMAARAETESRAGRHEAALAAVNDIRAVAERLRVASEALLAEEEPDPALAEGGTPAEVTKEDVAGLLRQLHRNELAAVERFTEMAPGLRTRLSGPQWHSLREHIDNLRFDEAAQMLAEF